MSEAENIAIERRIIDAYNLGDLDILDEVCSSDFVYHGPSIPDMDREGFKAALRTMHNAFPDWQISLEDIVATPDKATIRVSILGTQLGDFCGVRSTGCNMAWSAIIIDHLVNGKIVEEWGWMDYLGLMQQLSLVPEVAIA